MSLYVDRTKKHSCSTNHEALWLNQSGDITVQPSKRHSVFQPIRRHSCLTKLAIWLEQSECIKFWPIRRHSDLTSQEKRSSDHSIETSKTIVFLAGVKVKGSQCKWQRIQGVLAHLFWLAVCGVRYMVQRPACKAALAGWHWSALIERSWTYFLNPRFDRLLI